MFTLKVYGSDVTITEETFNLTCKWFADNCQGCIDEALSGKVRVNNLDQYVIDKEQQKEYWLDCKDYQNQSFTFYQRAYNMQTGENIPLFSN